MAKNYKFQDRAWNVTHRTTGKHLGVASVNGDSVREVVNAYKKEGSFLSEDQESITHELLDDQIRNLLQNNKIGIETPVDINEIQNEPRRGPRKSYSD